MVNLNKIYYNIYLLYIIYLYICKYHNVSPCTTMMCSQNFLKIEDALKLYRGRNRSLEMLNDLHKSSNQCWV
jgi:hypothetical protein